MNSVTALVRVVWNLRPARGTIPFLCRKFTSLGSSKCSLLEPKQCLQGHQTIQPSRSYKVRAVLKKRCAGCYFERRFGRLYVECTLKPRHKQMQLVTGLGYYRDDYSTKNWKKSVHWGYDNNVRFYKIGDTKWARYNWLKGRLGKDL